METLTIKELAPYLPYGVMGTYQLQDVLPSAIGPPKYELRNKELRPDSVDFFLKYCKPLLRPLSDLTKEIEVNGEKFIPEIWLKTYIMEKENYSHYDTSWIRELQYKYDISKISYWVMEKLYEWHFDTKNLISRRLAIDLNTIKETE